MKTKFAALILMVLVITSFKPKVLVGDDKVVTLAEFNALIDSVGLKFTMPADYKETTVKENKDLYYNFAIKNTKEDFEVRYSIWSLKPTIEEYKKCKLDSAHCTMIDPNKIYSGRAMSNVMNMTAGGSMEVGTFPPSAVKKEFNGDNGGSSFFEFKCEFGKGYKYGQMIVLHKNDVADVIITYLSNDKKKHPDLMMVPFHSLVFK
jgi:hypothetical protein